ncbi:putative WD repeat-containing protein 43-like isoform X2 [Capsicum annuum]|nr:putative WD repeat-containing protein 43-like isoform X2 [Capsicum annuum]
MELLRVWNTSSGSLFGQWRPENSGDSFSYMACCIVGKKRRNEQCLLVAIGSDDGNVLAVNISTGLVRWRKDGALPSGAASLFFVGKGRRIHAVAANGLVFEMNSKTGEVIKEFKGSKKPISLVAHSTNEKIIAVASDKLRFLSSESGKELLKFSPDSDAAQRIWLSNDAQFAVTAVFGEKQRQVWKLDFGERLQIMGIFCKANYDHSKSQQRGALIAYGSIESLEFTSVDISSPGKDIVTAAGEQAEKEVAAVQENGHVKKGADMEVEDANLIQRSKATNKRPASELDVTGAVTITDNGNGEPIDGVQIDDLNEPTMGEKLAMLNLADNNEDQSNNNLESAVQAKPPKC